MKENSKKIVVIMLLGIIAVGAYFISGTYAKYTSEVTGAGNANVAKWKWTIGTTEIKSSADKSFTFDLFKTIKDSDGSEEKDVAKGLIAPGTSGSFDVEITNNSEVNATYEISFVEEQTNLPEGVTRIPVEYSTDGGKSWKTTISGADIPATDIAMGASATKTVQWRWVYSVNKDGDTLDTEIGFAANNEKVPNVKVTAKITLTQVD